MALRNEMERIARSTRFPDRLREMYTVLGNDPFLVQECLARATLVDRWAHSLFAYDKRIHAETRREIEDLRRRLSSGALALESADSHRRLPRAHRESRKVRRRAPTMSTFRPRA